MISVVIQVECVAPGRFRRAHGNQLYAWFLDRVEAVASDLKLHPPDDSSERPVFALSHLTTLVPAGNESSVEQIAALGQHFEFRLSAVERGLCSLIPRILDGWSGGLRLGSARFRQTGATSRSEDHPLAGEVRPEELVGRWNRDASAPAKIRMEFRSPTAFHSPGHNTVFPLPEHVFSGLLDRWNRDAEPSLDGELVAASARMTKVSRYNLGSDFLGYPDFPQVGFHGFCEFELPARDLEGRQVLHLLADFGFFAGIGSRTAMGMGQIDPPAHYGRPSPGGKGRPRRMRARIGHVRSRLTT